MTAIGILLVIFLGIAALTPNKTEQGHRESRTAWLQKEGKDMQPKREKFIKELIKKGIIKKTEVVGSYPHVVVAPAFYFLDFDDKQAFMSVAFRYYYAMDERYDFIFLYDSKSGKSVGNYSVDSGLVMK